MTESLEVRHTLEKLFEMVCSDYWIGMRKFSSPAEMLARLKQTREGHDLAYAIEVLIAEAEARRLHIEELRRVEKYLEEKVRRIEEERDSHYEDLRHCMRRREEVEQKLADWETRFGKGA